MGRLKVGITVDFLDDVMLNVFTKEKIGWLLDMFARNERALPAKVSSSLAILPPTVSGSRATDSSTICTARPWATACRGLARPIVP